ncbi:MAG: hypothetical protein EBY17_31480, partial [Acidobacteriia bacterium]|nr:hypothetical protein [Terriglobia bacterium]
MEYNRFAVRLNIRWFHLWLGLLFGAFICVMGVSGTIVTFRPQLTGLLSPAAVSSSGCTERADWNRAEAEIEQYTGSKIDRLYFPSKGDPRIQMRIHGAEEKIYRHITYDGCAGKILGETNLGWMYWMVDFHHNLRADRTGRNWAGVIGIALLLS